MGEFITNETTMSVTSSLTDWTLMDAVPVTVKLMDGTFWIYVEGQEDAVALLDVSNRVLRIGIYGEKGTDEEPDMVKICNLKGDE